MSVINPPTDHAMIETVMPIVTAGKFALGLGQAAFVSGAGLVGILAVLPDFAGIAAGIVAIGFATVGVYAYFERKKLDAWKAMEQARIEIEKRREVEIGPLMTHRFDELAAQYAALGRQHAALVRQVDENTRITRANNVGIEQVKQVVTGSGDGIPAGPKA